MPKQKQTEEKKRKQLGAAKNNEDKELTGYRYCVDSTYPGAFSQLDQNLGTSRWMYNQYVGDYKRALDDGVAPVIKAPADYKSAEGNEWLREMDSLNLCNVQLNFTRAIKDFLSGDKGFPKFKSKKDHYDSYTTNNVNGNIKLYTVFGGMTYLKLPKINAPLRLIYHRPIPENGEIKSVTVSREPDGKYYVSILVATPKAHLNHKIDVSKAIGLDTSLPRLYIDSNGEAADFFKAFRQAESRLAKEQRKLSHMKKGSKNYEEQRLRIAKLHAKIKHQRTDMLHKISKELTDTYDIIGVEDLDMSAMKKALKFGKSVSDNGWGEFTRMLSYKAERKGKLLIKVGRWFPSSKTCCKCGHVHKELKLSDRQYVCPECDNVMDRDRQAAINIRDEAIAIYQRGLEPAA